MSIPGGKQPLGRMLQSSFVLIGVVSLIILKLVTTNVILRNVFLARIMYALGTNIGNVSVELALKSVNIVLFKIKKVSL